MPILSCSTFATGARQLVVHDALEMTVCSDLSTLWLTPYTMVGIDVLLARRRDHDFLRAAREMRAGLRLAGEQARALEHEIHAELAPRQLRPDRARPAP